MFGLMEFRFGSDTAIETLDVIVRYQPVDASAGTGVRQGHRDNLLARSIEPPRSARPSGLDGQSG